MSELSERRCIPCEGGIERIPRERAAKLQAELHPDWRLADDAGSIYRHFAFKNYYRTMSFVNAVAWIANRENHHPDLEVGYGHCIVRYSTHAIGGLSENDFICAAKIDALTR